MRAWTWLVLAGCTDPWSAAQGVPPITVDFDVHAPVQRVLLTLEVREPGLPRGERLEANYVDLSVFAQHYLDRCTVDECDLGVQVSPPGELHVFREILVDPGRDGELQMRLQGVLEPCDRRVACVREVPVRLSLIGDELVEVEFHAGMRVSGDSVQPLTTTDLRITAQVEPLDPDEWRR